MIDAMFELPSQNKKKYEVTLEYAKAQLEKANMARLQTAWCLQIRYNKKNNV